ncbi:MAG: hypothetical protein KatS3mg042_0340 [Rhodothermaceae bacterium]|nr:MAG: hypothetical protein KatS3mg042_0340 [Rhodothermaceae bacterium]
MKRMTYNASLLTRLLLVVCLIGALVTDARAGDEKRRGTAGAAELLVPLTARYASLGGTLTSGISTLNGLEALYANPAGLMLNGGTSAIFSRMEYVADIGVNYFGIAQRFGNNNIAFTVNSWDFGEIPRQTEVEPEITEVTFNADYIVAGLSYARQFTDRIAAGATFKVVNETIDDVSATALAVDAGMTYVVGESGLRLGVSLKNVGTKLSYSGTGLNRQVKLPDQRPDANNVTTTFESEGVELPSLLNFGFSYTREIGSGAVVTVLGNFRSNSFDQDQFGGGLEIGLYNVLYLRGGIDLMSESQDLTFYQGTNFGAGLNLDLAGTQVTLDYAYLPTDFFDAVQMFTVSVTL